MRRQIPLSALRMRLTNGSVGARWSVNPDGLIGRALVIPAPSAVSFPVTPSGEASLHARAMLLPHDWRDGRGELRASVTVAHRDGSRREAWAGMVRSASRRGHPRGLEVTCRLPRSATEVRLCVEAGGHAPGAVARAVWLEPLLRDPDAPGCTLGPSPGEQNGQPSDLPAAADRPHPAVRSAPPLISVLVPVHDPPLHMLEEAIASVVQQTFSNWELCLVDDGSTNPQVTAALQRHAATDPRIHLTRRDTPGGISTATNAALELATGEYIALLDHDDTLTPDALQTVADRIAAQPDLDMLYSDEDILLDGRQIWVHLKPGWSPDTLRTNGYTCHLGVYRRSQVGEIGGFRTEFNGSQDVDMILRLVERTDRIAHIPRILYHWRAHANSTAGGDAKPYAYVAARNAIASHLERSGLEAEVGYGPPGLYRVTHRVDRSTSVDLVLSVDNELGVAEAAASWLDQPHPSWNVVITAPAAALDSTTAALTQAGIPESRITAIPAAPGTSPADALAAAATAATSQHLLLMQSPAMGLTHDWLTRLIGYSNQPHIAAAGPIVLAPDGRIQQAGIAIPEGIPLHLLYGTRSSMDDFFGFGTSVYNVSAVSGVLVTPRDTYQQLGGLDPQFKDLALIHYCLRATDHHQRIVIVPDARLRTTGPDPARNDLPTIWQLRHTWARTHTHDPYYNPNYRTDRGDFILRRHS
jgi:O-antigen biosynthesis protein